MDPSYPLDSSWYWAMFEGAMVSDGLGTCAARDFLRPLAAVLADGRFVVDAIAVDPDDLGVTYRVDGVVHSIRLAGVAPQALVPRLLAAINHSLADTGYAFELVVARRYELRGVLVPRKLADGSRAIKLT